MSELSSEARALIHGVGIADGGMDPERRARLEGRIAASIALGGVAVSTIAQAATGTIPAVASAPAVGASKLFATAVVGALLAGAGLGVVSMVTLRSFTEPSHSGRAATEPSSTGLARPGRESARFPSLGAEESDPPIAAKKGPTSAVDAVSKVPSPASFATGLSSRSPEQSDEIAGPVASPLGVKAGKLGRDLALETRWIEAIRRELDARRAPRALELLREYEEGFPVAVFREEGSALRILALCQLGRRAEARSVAEAFLGASSSSPLVPRIRQSCVFSGSNGESEGP